jgi:hypothetical protein
VQMSSPGVRAAAEKVCLEIYNDVKDSLDRSGWAAVGL